MTASVTRSVKARGASLRPRLRGAGRVALWALVALLLFRGVASVVAGSARQSAPVKAIAGALDDGSAAFAVRFARSYLADPSARSLARYFAEGSAPLPASVPASWGQDVAQAEVAGTQRIGRGRAIVTVSCELLGGRVLYLAVPIVRDDAGEVAALGAPSLVAAPEVAEVDAERPQPLSGAEAGAIGELADKFLAAYVASDTSADLSYYVEPGSSVEPLGGLSLVGAPNTSAIGGERARRTVLATVRVRDEAGGVTYPLSYRLELVKRERWYVSAVEGAVK